MYLKTVGHACSFTFKNKKLLFKCKMPITSLKN